MQKITLTDKRNKATTELQSDRALMTRPGVLVIETNRSEIVGVERIGNGVLVRLRNGKSLAVDDFFRADSSGLIGDIVIREPNGSLYWWSNPLQDWGLAKLEPLPAIDPLLLTEEAGVGMVVTAFAPGGGLLAVLGGVAALGAAAAAGSSSGGSGSTGSTVVPPAGGGTTVIPPAGGGTPVTATVPAASNGLSLAEINSGVAVNIVLPSAAVAGDRITVSIDARQAVTTTLSAADVTAGRISLVVPSATLLAAGEGAANVIVTATDSAGVARAGSPATVGVVIDTLAPQLLNPNPNSYADNVGPVQSAFSREPVSDDATPGLNIGTIPAGTTASLFVNGLRTAATYDPATGTLTPNAPLPNGTHDLSYSLTDVAGNESVRSGSLRLTVASGTASGMTIAIPENADGGINAAEAADGVAVVVTLPNTLAGGMQGAASAVGGPTAGALASSSRTGGLDAQASMALPLAAAAGDRVSVSIDGGVPVTVVLTAADVAAGRVTVTLPFSAIEAAGQGTGLVTAVYTNTAGVSSQPVTAEVFIDTQPPVLTLTTPTTYIDNVGPVQSNTSSASVTDDSTPGLNIGSIPAGTKAILYINGVAVPATYEAATGALTPDSPLPNGSARLTYSLTDEVGNASAQSNPLVLTVNTNVPTGMAVAVPANADGGINAAEAAGGVSVVVTLPAGAAAGERVAVNIDDGTPVEVILVAADISAGRITVTLPPAAITAAGQGEGLVSAVYTNSAGAVSPAATAPVFIDTIVPTLTNASPNSYADNVGLVQSPMSTAAVTDDDSPGLNIGTVPTDATPVLFVNGVAVAATYDPVSGTLTPDVALPNGEARLSYRLKDLVGNESALSNPLTLTVNTKTPRGLAVSVPENFDGGISAADASDGVVVLVTLPQGSAAGEQISLDINGSAPTNVTLVQADVNAGRISVTLPPSAITAAGQGPAVVTAVYTNAAGVPSDPATADVFIDTLAPTLIEANPSSYDDNVDPVRDPKSTASVTNDATPGLNIGALPVDATPVLYVNGKAVASTYDPATGTLTPNASLPNGSASLSYSLKDALGNESPMSGALNLTINTSVPAGLSVAVPANADGGISAAEAAAGVQVIVGLPNGAVVGERVSVSIDGGTPVSTNLSAADLAAGRVTLVLPNSAILAAGQGAGVVSAVFTNAAGTASAPATASVFIDTLAPTLSNSSPSSYNDNVGPVQNANSTAAVTDDTTPGLNIGAVPAGATALLYVNGQVVPSSYTATSATAGTLTPLNALPNGTATLAYSLRDAVGNESAVSNPLRLTINTSPPGAFTVSVPSMADGVINAAEASAGVSVSVALPAGAALGDSIQYAFGLGTASATIGATELSNGRAFLTINTPLFVPQGSSALRTTYVNGAGLSSSVTTDLFLDSIAPGAYSVAVPESGGGGISALEAADGVPVLVALPTNAAVGDVVGVNINNGASVFLTLTATEIAARQATVVLPASAIAAAGQGAATVRTSYTDAAGNPSASSPVSTSVNIDTVAPVLGNTNPNSYRDNVGLIQSPMSTAAVTDDGTPGLVIGTLPADAMAILFVNGSAVASVYDPATGTLTPSATLTDGVYELAYSLRDTVGNESPRSANLRLTVDTVPPAAPSAAITNYRDDVGSIQSNTSTANATDDTRPGFIIGSLPSDASGAQLFVDGRRVDASYDAATGTLTPTSALQAAGVVQTYQFSYTLSDAAGNQSSASSNFALTLDTQGPTLNISQSTQPGVPTLTFRFSEAVAGFTQGDVTVTNGTLLNFTAVDDRTFTANVLPTGVSAPSVSVAAGSYTDTVGNPGAAASLATTLTDTTPPVLQSAATSADGRTLILTYNETLDAANLPANNAFTVLSGTPAAPNAVTGISMAGNVVTLTLTNAIPAGSTINLSYLDPTPNNDARAIQDVAGNDAATQASVSVVNQVTPAAITASIAVEPATLAAGQTAAVTITFSGVPTGFTLADLTAEGGTLTGLTTAPQLGLTGSATYTATFTPNAGVNDTTNVITLAAGSYTDALGRPGGGATSNNYVVNTTNPLAPITPTFLAISEDTLTGANTTNSDYITADRILTVSGSINRALAAGEKVQLQVDGGAWMDATVNAAEPTVWFLGLTTALAPGAHTLAARVVDGTGVMTGTGTSQSITIVANAAPVVATSTNGGLLGIVSLDALGGALNLAQQQALSATDVDNNLRQVVISTGGVANLVNLGTITASQPLAAELGLVTAAATTGGVLGVGSTNTLTITAQGGGELDNLRLEELLATINLNGGAPVASLTVATSVTIAATDVNNLTATTTGNVTALSLSALSLVLPGAVVFGTEASEALNGDANDNRLYGFGGNDTLNGGAGNDLLRGGAGADVLNGGAGNDLLIFDAADTSIDGGDGIDVLRVEATSELNLVAGSAVRNIETVNLGKGDGRSTAVISSAGLLANGSQTILIEGDQEDQVTLQGGTFNGQVLVGRQAFKEYLFTINGQTFTVRIEDGVPITVLGGGG